MVIHRLGAPGIAATPEETPGICPSRSPMVAACPHSMESRLKTILLSGGRGPGTPIAAKTGTRTLFLLGCEKLRGVVDRVARERIRRESVVEDLGVESGEGRKEKGDE